MGELLLAAGVACVVGVFIGKRGGKLAIVLGVLCWCVVPPLFHRADTLQGWEPIFPLLEGGLCASLGLGLFVGAAFNIGVNRPQDPPKEPDPPAPPGP